MTLSPYPQTKTLDELIEEAERELTMRERHYPSWVIGPVPRLKGPVAQHRLDVQKAIVAELKKLKAARPKAPEVVQANLF